MATTDTEVDLVVNEMTQEQLDELDAAGTVPPNQMFFTDGDNDAILSLPVGSIFASAIPLTDVAFHLLDGSVISQTGIYEDFSNLLKSLVTAGYAITCTLSQYETDVANTGNCGKFVIDNTAGTIKLPTITKFVEGLSNLTDIGKSLQAGLPNITGNTTGNTWNEVGFGSWTSGAFQISNIGSDATEHFNPVWAAGATRRPTNVNLNASRSSAVYGRSSEVQPNATRFPYYIVLANSYKSKVALNVDNILQEVDTRVAKSQNANTIISAPANFISYSGSVVTVKAGTRVVIPNGLNADGSPNNLDYTLPADATLNLSNYANDTRYIAVQKDGTLITLMHPYGADDYRVYYQYSQPSVDRTYARWFDMTNNVWKNTQDGGATWVVLYCCPVASVGIGSGVVTSLVKHKVPTDFSFTEMDKLYADINYQNLNRTKQAKLVSGSNIKTVNNYSLLGSGNINLMSFSAYDEVYTDAAANTTVTLRTYENEIKVVYFWFNATTNNKSLTVKDTWTGQNIAYMANIGGYNQYHLATIFMPRNREYNFTTTIAAKYTVVKITC